jgi:C4-dicarboxylate-specific signal transduction histidine kinase
MTMGQLGTSIAHEISQPLAAILMSSSACIRWLEKNDLGEAKKNLERVMSAANRAGEVVMRVRALTGSNVSEKVQFDIGEVIEEVITFTQSELNARQVSLRKELQAEVPPVVGDRVQLQQVLLNLIMNGVEAMDPVVDRARELVITLRRDGRDAVVVTVQDSGAGLDPNHAPRIFEAFFTTKPKGMGMGLSISASIIEAHGGRLWATSAQPHGAAFHFTVPIADGSRL